MRTVFLLMALVFNAGCVSFSRHADLLADTKTEALHGTCADTRYVNSIEI